MSTMKLDPEALCVESFPALPVDGGAVLAIGGSLGTGCRDCTYEPVCPTDPFTVPSGPIVV